MQTNLVSRRTLTVRSLVRLFVCSLVLIGLSRDGQACHWRRHCSCRCARVTCYTTYPAYVRTAPVVASPQYSVPTLSTAQPVVVQSRHTLVMPNGKRYLVTVTNEPGTEEELKREQEEKLRKLPPQARAAASQTELFAGHDRKAAKTSIATGGAVPFATVGNLLDSLVADNDMLNHVPPISKDADSDRLAEEQRNVTVSAFIYAAKTESDNDFHLILGTDDPPPSTRFINAEVSGLPSTGPFRAPLQSVRDKFKAQFASAPIGDRYEHFSPPIPVQVTGSIFFDIDHAPGVVGPTGMRPKTSWEIHPVTNIDFGP